MFYQVIGTMRLLDTHTGLFCSVTQEIQKTPYAILSHVWAKKEDPRLSGAPFIDEQSYEDVCKIQKDHKDELDSDPNAILVHLTPKIQRFCEVAREAGYDYGWVDTCCIDQTSSAELSEAINSMYNWYRHSSVCYVFLHDVHKFPSEQRLQSVWFFRGWTLQELIAPSIVIFYTSDWNPIGSKHTLSGLIEKACNVDREVLTFEKSLDKVCVARRMSWAAPRKTSRDEDHAYSLMGLFGVNMPTMYGEDGTRAFIRLQEEILKHIPDQSILIWGRALPVQDMFNEFAREEGTLLGKPQQPSRTSQNHCLLASSPSDFRSTSTGELTTLSPPKLTALLNLQSDSGYPTYTLTSYGIHAQLPLLTISPRHPSGGNRSYATHLAILACQHGDSKNGFIVALLLRRRNSKSSNADFFAGAAVGYKAVQHPLGSPAPRYMTTDVSFEEEHYYRMAYVSIPLLRQHASKAQMMSAYIPIQLERGSEEDSHIHANLCQSRTDEFYVRIEEWSRKILSSRGYTIATKDGDKVVVREPLNAKFWAAGQPEVVIKKNDKTLITIQVGRCWCQYGSPVHGYVAIRVESNMRYSEEDETQHHSSDHHTHLSSHAWRFHSGVVSRDSFSFPDDGGTLRLRITFTRDRKNVMSYLLGAEVWSSPALPPALPSPAYTDPVSPTTARSPTIISPVVYPVDGTPSGFNTGDLQVTQYAQQHPPLSESPVPFISSDIPDNGGAPSRISHDGHPLSATSMIVATQSPTVLEAGSPLPTVGPLDGRVNGYVRQGTAFQPFTLPPYGPLQDGRVVIQVGPPVEAVRPPGPSRRSTAFLSPSVTNAGINSHHAETGGNSGYYTTPQPPLPPQRRTTLVNEFADPERFSLLVHNVPGSPIPSSLPGGIPSDYPHPSMTGGNPEVYSGYESTPNIQYHPPTSFTSRASTYLGASEMNQQAVNGTVYRNPPTRTPSLAQTSLADAVRLAHTIHGLPFSGNFSTPRSQGSIAMHPHLHESQMQRMVSLLPRSGVCNAFMYMHL